MCKQCDALNHLADEAIGDAREWKAKARRLEEALRGALASLEVHAATAAAYAKTRDTEANNSLAAEIRRNVAAWRKALD